MFNSGRVPSNGGKESNWGLSQGITFEPGIDWHTDVQMPLTQVNLQAIEGGSLLKLPFTTIFEYLQVLHVCFISLSQMGVR